MENRAPDRGETLLDAHEVGEILGVSNRMVLYMPLPQIRLGPKTIRFRLRDVYALAGIEVPNEKR